MEKTPIRIEYSGQLEALAQGGKSWKLKFFIIRDNFLMYYKDLNSNKPEGVIPLEGAKIALSDMERCFEVTTGNRKYHLRVLAVEELNGWMEKVVEASNLSIESLYELNEVLGQGNFSKVRRAVEKASRKEFAIKIIDKLAVAQNRESILTEIAILKQVKHPHVIQLHQIFESKKKIYLITELLQGGELFDRIVERGSFSEADASVLMKSIVEALQYLHSKGIVHCDLKPENLLYDTTNDDAKIKISDFGLSKFTDSCSSPASSVESNNVFETARGTPGYVAPEVLEQRGYDKSVDLWSVGVILYILLCGFPPFYAHSDAELYELIKSGEFSFPSPYWDKISDSVKGLICSLLQRNPALRATPEQILNHPWIQGTGVSSENIGTTLSDHLKAQKKLRDVFIKIKAINRFYQSRSISSPKEDAHINSENVHEEKEKKDEVLAQNEY